jgi:hypothetical protein
MQCRFGFGNPFRKVSFRNYRPVEEDRPERFRLPGQAKKLGRGKVELQRVNTIFVVQHDVLETSQGMELSFAVHTQVSQLTSATFTPIAASDSSIIFEKQRSSERSSRKALYTEAIRVLRFLAHGEFTHI